MANQIEFDVKVSDAGAVSANAKIKASNDTVEESFHDVDAAAKKAGEGIGSSTEKAAKRVKGASAQAAAGLAKVSRSSGQAGIQIQQFVGQVQAGTQPLLAFSQQAADLGIVMGAPLLGAIVGIGASLAMAFIPQVTESEDKVGELIETLKELQRTQLLTAEQAEFLAATESKSIKDKEEAIKKLEEQIKLEQTRNDRLKATDYGSWEKEQKKVSDSLEESTIKILSQRASIKLLQSQIEESKLRLQAYSAASSEGTKQTEEQIESVKKLVESLQAQADAIGKTERQIALQKATQDGANQSQIDAINAAYDAIEAEEERVKAAILAQRELLKAQREASAERLKIEREEEAERLKIKREAEQQSAARVSAVEQIRQEIMTEQQLMAQKFITDGEMLKEALANEEITKAEFDAIERERVAQHQQALIALENQSVNERIALQKKYEATVASMRNAALQNAAGLLDQFAGQSKAAAIASIAINKGLSLAQNTQNTLVAQTRALAELGPVAGPPMAATIGAYGKLNGALIAATGLAQAANVSNGNTAQFSGGVPATATTTNSSAVAQAPNRTFDIRGLNPSDMVSGQQVYDLLKALAGDGYDFNFIGG